MQISLDHYQHLLNENERLRNYLAQYSLAVQVAVSDVATHGRILPETRAILRELASHHPAPEERGP